MRRLVQHIFESNMDDMKSFILQSVESIVDEKTIKRIYELLSKSGNETSVNEYLESRGLKESLGPILRIFEANACLTEFYKVCNGEIELPTVSQLISDNNIYKVFGNLGFDEETLKELAILNLPHNGTATGYYEILTQLFIKDLSKKNSGRGDINVGSNFQIEYKAPNARIRGRSLKPSSLIESKFRELIGDRLDFSKLPQKTGALSSQSNIKYIFSKELKDSDPDEMATIIAQSIYEQFRGQYEIEWISFVQNHVKDIFPGNKCSNVNAKFIQTLFGIAGLFFYQHDEKFTHMMLFKGTKKNSDGDYIVMTEDMFNTFESLKNAIKLLNIQFNSFPKTDGKITPQDEAIQIFVK